MKIPIPDIKALSHKLNFDSSAIFYSSAIKEKSESLIIFLRAKTQQIDMKSLGMAVGSVVGIYALLFFYVYLNNDEAKQALIKQIPSETVSIQKVEKPKEVAPPEYQEMQTDIGPEDPMYQIEGLYQYTPEGKLPVIQQSNKLTSFRAYQHPFSFEGLDLKKPVLAFVIADYGLSTSFSQNALDNLPSEVSFMLSPYSSLPAEWVEMAAAKGHEIWVQVPVQNEKKEDIGQSAIFHHSSLAEKQRVLHRVLAKTQGYIGVSSYTDKGSEMSKSDYLKLAEEMYGRGLGFFELNPNAPDFIRKKALTIGAPYIQANAVVYTMNGKEGSFEALEAVAKEQGYAVAIVPNFPEMIGNLSVWLLKVAQAEYIIAPVSAMYDLPLHKTPSKVSARQEVEEVTPTHLEPSDRIEPKEDIHQGNHH